MKRPTRVGHTRAALRTTHPVTGGVLSPETIRHNAYVYGFEDGASDDFDWPDYGHGVAVGGQDYRDGFDAGRAARASAFDEARKRAGRKEPA